MPFVGIVMSDGALGVSKAEVKDQTLRAMGVNNTLQRPHFLTHSTMSRNGPSRQIPASLSLVIHSA